MENMKRKILELMALEEKVTLSTGSVSYSEEQLRKAKGDISEFWSELGMGLLTTIGALALAGVFLWMWNKNWRGPMTIVLALVALGILVRSILCWSTVIGDKDSFRQAKELKTTCSRAIKQDEENRKQYNALLKQLSAAKKHLGPEYANKKMYFDIPLDVRMHNAYMSTTPHNLRVAGPIRFTEKEGEKFVDGFSDPAMLSYDQVLALLQQPNCQLLLQDKEYLSSHKDEQYKVTYFNRFSGRYCERITRIQVGQIYDIDASLENYSKPLDEKVRQQEYMMNAGGSYGAYASAVAERDRKLKRKKEELELNNALAIKEEIDYPSIEITEESLGFLVYGKMKKPVAVFIANTPLSGMVFEYELPKPKTLDNAMNLRELHKPQGKVLNYTDFKQDFPVYIPELINYVSKGALPGLSLTDACPSDLPENLWKYLLYRNFHNI